MSVLQKTPSGPAWEIAKLFPDQGHWTEDDYLAVTKNVRSLVELVDGHIEVLPMPTASHQNIVVYFLTLLRAFVSSRKLGYVLPAPLGIAEYWVIDSHEVRVTVLKLTDGEFVVHAEASTGGRVSSALLPGFELSVDEVFAAAEFPSF